jgi:hypothetical protein
MSTTATECASAAIPEPVQITSTSSSQFTVNYLDIAKSADIDIDNAVITAGRRTPSAEFWRTRSTNRVGTSNG